jgi:hypothetical protein
MSADRKYTDRDVRENQNFYQTVIDYLDTYEGEFDFLVDCKMRVAMDRDLTVGMVRGVLNCMRHDPRVTDLPEPLPPQEGKVLHMPIKKKKKKSRGKPCDIEGFHPKHGGFVYKDGDYFYADGYEFCDGKYEINRDDFEVPAHLAVPYIMSRSGKLIHKVNGEAWYMWRPLRHEWGWRYAGDGDPDLYARTLCTFPRIVNNPILLPSWKLDEALASLVGSSAHSHELCKRCFG